MGWEGRVRLEAGGGGWWFFERSGKTDLFEVAVTVG